MSTHTVDSPVTATMFTRKMGEAMRQQSVCIEIPVTIQGSRNSPADTNNPQGTKTFVEESRTMIVFPMGAVVRFSEPVSEGQVLILKNLRMNREVACRVVCSKTSANVKGFVEVEFVQPAVGFWGISFPTPNSNAQSSADAQASRPGASGSASMQSGSFRVPTMPPRKPAVTPNPAPQAIAPPPVVKPDATPIPSLANDNHLNNAIAAANHAPVEHDRKPESIPSVSMSVDSIPKADVQAHKDHIPAPHITIPLATADSIEQVGRNGAVDLAGLIVGDSQADEDHGTTESGKNPALDLDSHAATPAITSIVMPDTHKSSSTLSHRIDAPAMQHSALLSKDISFGVQISPAPSRRTGLLVGVSALIVVSIAGAGAYWWYYMRGAATHAAATSDAAQTNSTQPAANPAVTPAVSAPINNPVVNSNTQTVPPAQPVSAKKTGANSEKTSRAVANARDAKQLPVEEDIPATPARRPNIISSKMPAPKTPSGNSANANNLIAPDLTTPNSRPTSTSPILTGMSSLPAPPPAPVAVKPTPAPAAPEIKQPRLLSTVTAIYPKMAAIRGDYGVVSVDALVSETGRVTSAKAQSGPVTLRESAVDAVLQQRYSPATINGKPTATHVTVNVEFKKKQ
ncbi:MAG TPA: TonB family protein [Candidatus Acidoferrales bacterium]|nr:TonB family protein [Candidatus Acidoferrales bacterium]